jgi:selenocysteine lyase/cysteine desulfurase
VDQLAADRGFEVEWVDVTEDLRLDYDDLANRLDERVRVVACVGSSNAIGTIVDVARVSEPAHDAGALCWVDAVQYTAHVPTDVQALGCDVFIASAYKFCGPHLGVAYGRHELLESWRPYKARPASSEPVGRRFEVGTAPYELLAGFSATLAYLESIGGMEAIAAYERELGQRFLDGLPDGATVYGLQTMDGRVPVSAVPKARRPSGEAAPGRGLRRGRTTAGTRSGCGETRPDSVRVGLSLQHRTEIDRFNAALAQL